MNRNHHYRRTGYWKQKREDKKYYEKTGMWPGQKICQTCAKAFTPKEQWHPTARAARLYIKPEQGMAGRES